MGNTFLGGSRPGAEDAVVYAAAASLPVEALRAAPAVKGWLQTVGMFAPAVRARWGGDAGTVGESAVAVVAAAAATGRGDVTPTDGTQVSHKDAAQE